jgi:rRNA maturation endonuclease Nob1
MPFKCEFCGTEYENPPGKFCDACGRVIQRLNLDREPESEEFKKCLKCGHRNKMEARVCWNCGELLRDPGD